MIGIIDIEFGTMKIYCCNFLFKKSISLIILVQSKIKN